MIAVTGVSVMRNAKHSQWWDFLEGMAVIGSAMFVSPHRHLAPNARRPVANMASRELLPEL